MDLAHGGDNFRQKDVLRPPAVVLIPGLVMAFYVWLVLVTTIPYPGKIGLDYNTLGTDWMVFYGAIRSVLDGNAALIFDGDRFTDFLNTNFAGLALLAAGISAVGLSAELSADAAAVRATGFLRLLCGVSGRDRRPARG